ncbi:MAG: hypothetical protein PHX51_05045 [Clostridia bacterium]|nr:hypothetical protein [Clostridia bacterium]
MMEVNISRLLSLLYKKAKGYNAKEISEEYAAGENGEMILCKKRVATKHFPPDISALKYIMELNGNTDLSKLSDEELKQEKIRLLELLKNDLGKGD